MAASICHARGTTHSDPGSGPWEGDRSLIEAIEARIEQAKRIEVAKPDRSGEAGSKRRSRIGAAKPDRSKRRWIEASEARIKASEGGSRRAKRIEGP
jgi:hypothetical protein